MRTKFSSSNGVKVNNDTSTGSKVTMKKMASESSAPINNNNTINNTSQQEESNSSCPNINNNNVSSNKLLVIADSRHFSRQVTCTTLISSKMSSNELPSKTITNCTCCTSDSSSKVKKQSEITPSECSVMNLNVPSNTSLCNCNESILTVDIVKNTSNSPGKMSPTAATPATTTTTTGTSKATTTIVDRIIEEIIETEKSYSRDLRDIINGYLYFVTRNKNQQSINKVNSSCNVTSVDTLIDQVNYSIENNNVSSSPAHLVTCNEFTSSCSSSCSHSSHSSCQVNSNLCHKQRDIKYLCEVTSFNNHSTSSSSPPSLPSPNVINGNTQCNLTSSPYANEIAYSVNCGQMCTDCRVNNSSLITVDGVNCGHKSVLNDKSNKQVDVRQFTNCPKNNFHSATGGDEGKSQNNSKNNNCQLCSCVLFKQQKLFQSEFESIAKSKSTYSSPASIALDSNNTMNDSIYQKEELPSLSQGKLSSSLDSQQQFTADTCDVNSVVGAIRANTNVSICSCCLCREKSSTNFTLTTEVNTSTLNHGDHHHHHASLKQVKPQQPRQPLPLQDNPNESTNCNPNAHSHEQLVNAYDSTCPNSTCQCKYCLASIDNLTRTCHQSLCPSMSSRHETCQLVSHNNNQKQVHQSNLNTGNIDTESLPSAEVLVSSNVSMSNCKVNCINCKCQFNPATGQAKVEKHSPGQLTSTDHSDSVKVDISPEQLDLLSKITPEEVSKVISLFGNLEQIAQFSGCLLSSFQEALANGQGNSLLTASLIASIFVEKASQFQVYTEYCAIDYPRSHTLLDELMANDTMKQLFIQQQIKLNHSLPLATYLLKPVQRVLKYPLLLQSLLKNVQKQFEENIDTDSQVVSQLKSALNCMTEYACKMNEAKREQEELNQNLFFNNNNCFNRLRRNSSSSNSSSRSRKSSTLRRSISSFSSSSSTTSSTSSVTVSNIVTAIRDLVIAVKESSKKRKKSAIKLYKKIITIAKKDSNSSAIYTFK